MGRVAVLVMQQASAEVTCRVVEVARQVEVLGEPRTTAVVIILNGTVASGLQMDAGRR